MPIVFDEISGEIAPPSDSEHTEQDASSSPERQAFNAAELLRRELLLTHERQHRLIAD